MSIQLDDLQDAAFWNAAVCLDCASRFDVEAADTALDEDGRTLRSLGPCPDCGSRYTFQATLALAILERIDRSEE